MGNCAIEQQFKWCFIQSAAGSAGHKHYLSLTFNIYFRFQILSVGAAIIRNKYQNQLYFKYISHAFLSLFLFLFRQISKYSGSVPVLKSDSTSTQGLYRMCPFFPTLYFEGNS